MDLLSNANLQEMFQTREKCFRKLLKVASLEDDFQVGTLPQAKFGIFNLRTISSTPNLAFRNKILEDQSCKDIVIKAISWSVKISCMSEYLLKKNSGFFLSLYQRPS